MIVRGVFNSCEASEIKSRCLLKAISMGLVTLTAIFLEMIYIIKIAIK